MRTVKPCIISVVIVAACFSLALAQEAPKPADADPIPKEVREFFGDYLESFNKGDTVALAKMWAEDAHWASDESAESTEGREAIVAELKAAFATSPGLKLSGNIDRLHPVAQGVASLDGTVVTSRRDEEPSTTSFSAIVVKDADGWRFSSVREFAPPAAATPYEKLSELEHLIGEWRDETEGATVTTLIRWGAGRSFLVRSYTVESEDAEPLQGTQIIGWDQRQLTYRSWSFDSHGSFGEGIWSRAGDEWVGRLSQTLPDGGTASATQVIRRIDENALEVETVGREIDGEPQPSAPPVRVVRIE